MITKKKSAVRLNIPATASLWYSLSNVISRGATFIFTSLFTRILSPAEYGMHSVYTSYIGIFTVLTTLEISGNAAYLGLSRFEGENKDRFISSAIGLQFFLTVASFTVYMLFRGPINGATTLTTEITLLLFLQVLINSVEGIYFAKKRYSYDYKPVVLINVVSGIISPLLAVILIRLGYGEISRITAPLAVGIAFILPIIFETLKRNRTLFSIDTWKFLLSVCLPMLPHYLALSVIAQNDKIIIAKTLGEAAVGKYSVAYSVGYMLSLLTGGLALGFAPWMIRKLKAGQIDKIKDSLSASIGTISALTLIFLVAVPEIFGFLAPSEYIAALPVIYPVSASVTFAFLSSLLTSAILCSNRATLLSKNTVLTAIISVVLSFIFIRKFGLIGGACSTFLSYLILFLLNLSTAKRLLGENLISVRALLKCISILLFFVPLLFILRGVILSRILLFFAFILIFAPDLKRCRTLLNIKK